MKKIGYIKLEQYNERREHFLQFQRELQETVRTLQPLPKWPNPKYAPLEHTEEYGFYISCDVSGGFDNHEDCRYYYAQVFSADWANENTLRLERKEALADLVSYILYDWGPYDYRIIVPTSPDSTVEKT